MAINKMGDLKKWFLTCILTGLLSSTIVSAKGSEVVINGVNNHLKPIKKHKKKRYSNKVANKARRTWHKI